MRIFRASETSVVCDEFVYEFDSKQEADSFEKGLEDHSLEKCRMYYQPASIHRCPVKLKSQADFFAEVREARERRILAFGEHQKDQRQNKFEENRRRLGSPSAPSTSATSSSQPVLLPVNVVSIDGPQNASIVPVVRPYEGKHVCYVVHGHGGHLDAWVRNHPQVNYPKVRLRFYCAKGETTQDTERRNRLNAPTKLIAALLTSRADVSRVHESVEPDGFCEPLMIQGDPDPSAWPHQGIWFVARESADSAPYERVKICEAPQSLTSFLTILQNNIVPDGRRRKLKAPVEIFWVACRALIRSTQDAVTAVANTNKRQ